MTAREPEKWHEVPGLLALVVVGGALAILCLLATVFGWW